MPTVTLAYATQPCIGCGEGSIIELDPARYARWVAGEHVQDVWPEWTPEQRELLITGTHPACWAELFPPEEEE